MKTPEHKKFYYLAVWGRLRNYKLSMNPFCKCCGAIAIDVHHVLDRKKRPDLELEITNLESLCKQCHSSHTAKENNKPGKIINYKWE